MGRDCFGPESPTWDFEGAGYGFYIGPNTTIELLDRAHVESGPDELLWIRTASGREGVIACHNVRTLLLGRDSC